MSSNRLLRDIALGVALIAGTASAQDTPVLGTETTPGELKNHYTTVFPDGEGLPPGGGTVQDGKLLYQDQCADCHGEQGEGDMSKYIPILASDGKPEHGFLWSTGYSWPYATSIFDYVRVAMPPFSPKELSDEETYAVTAYILHLNGFLPEDGSVTRETLPQVKMPAQDYFGSLWEKEERRR